MADRPLDKDPFPEVACALLHSGDIHRYAITPPIGKDKNLFEPFIPKQLKSASYEVPFEGTAYFWDADGENMRTTELTTGASFEIPRNSIVFVRPSVMFTIPDYLALRFNLHIRLVHRGLLLGTGPLVDPGFRGRLLIPVHNLTDSSLRVDANEGFIWIEVTKVSRLHVGDPPKDDDAYVVFPEKKKDRQPWEYFKNASDYVPIRSSLTSMQRELNRGTAEVRRLGKAFQVTGLVGGISVALAVAALIYGGYSVIESTKGLVMSASQSVQDSRGQQNEELRHLSERVANLEQHLNSLAASSPSSGSPGKR